MLFILFIKFIYFYDLYTIFFIFIQQANACRLLFMKCSELVQCILLRKCRNQHLAQEGTDPIVNNICLHHSCVLDVSFILEIFKARWCNLNKLVKNHICEISDLMLSSLAKTKLQEVSPSSEVCSHCYLCAACIRKNITCNLILQAKLLQFPVSKPSILHCLLEENISFIALCNLWWHNKLRLAFIHISLAALAV